MIFGALRLNGLVENILIQLEILIWDVPVIHLNYIGKLKRSLAQFMHRFIILPSFLSYHDKVANKSKVLTYARFAIGITVFLEKKCRLFI